MNKKIINIIKTTFILLLFLNSGYIFRFIYDFIGISLNSYKKLAYADLSIGIFLIIVVLLLYNKKIKEDFKLFKLDLKTNMIKVLKLFGKFYTVKIIISIIVAMIGTYFGYDNLQSQNQHSIDLLFKSAPALIFISSVFLAPIYEEIVFRLSIKKVINNNYIFVIVSGFIFGLIHIFPTELKIGLALLQSVIYVSMGMMLAHFYVKENNIYYVVIIHALNNLVGMLAALLLV